MGEILLEHRASDTCGSKSRPKKSFSAYKNSSLGFDSMQAAMQHRKSVQGPK